jgi:hypothetical protein
MQLTLIDQSLLHQGIAELDDCEALLRAQHV